MCNPFISLLHDMLILVSSARAGCSSLAAKICKMSEQGLLFLNTTNGVGQALTPFDRSYILSASILDLETLTWQLPYAIPDHQGLYRSISVSSRYTSPDPSGETTLMDNDGNPLELLPYPYQVPGGGSDFYTYSNSNFTDVRRQLIRGSFETATSLSSPPTTTDLTHVMTSNSRSLPPGLRFPFACLILSLIHI